MNKEYLVSQNSFKKHWNILLEKIICGLKANKEYKIHFWSVILLDVINILCLYFFYFVYGDLMLKKIGWSQMDFFVFLCFLMFAAKMSFQFSLRNFPARVFNGSLNNTLTKPLNVFFYENLYIFQGGNFMSMIIFCGFFFIVFQFTDYYHILLGIATSLFGVIYYVCFINFIESFAFFMKYAHSLFQLIDGNISLLVKNFTPKVFEGSAFASLFFVLPSAIYAYFVVEILKGNFDVFLSYLPYILGVLFVMVFGTWILWHFGLKKYEAFG